MKSLTPHPHSSSRNSHQAVVRVQNLVYAYPHQEPVLHNISFTLNAGDRVALMGATGSGKSTLLENLIGIKQPQSGKIWINDISLEPQTLPEVRRYIGFGFQDANDQLFMPTILEDITFGPLNYGVPAPIARDQARHLLADFGLEAYANRSAHELSGGQRRLAALAAILALEPAILILDEPTTGLDPAWRRHLARVLLNLPVQVMLIASHELHWLGKVTQRALVLSNGRIQVDNEIQPLLQNGEILEQLGLPIDW
ncbi:ABC transporter ATP-binding protein [Trichormus variabilis ARAD]|uniref:ABC transporter ATP-binding protein n=1 Tax=Trichormus variabilis N2B TaxID=2681315 RepID=A0ABR6S6S8_ANAVA|nr:MULTISPECIES: ABC transporter ATP-binding protein [Nostocaceae]MBC1213625.1 ABC transporter ATP-binding protein [Trichormus variabilis ARAD]MBC1254959.1 ABC transporter ATP-binding protein [Trichormus variabilis V5]MBC1268250.1 ABC transporter ATP-binding protein [Trichormus variabilis FSR]MBC1302083.1 ABC transporter ATP-binding protein [Trichormus variabilis N2B]MBC1310370.1 ABC transporter ATP-binding protein [Trichormus variabilis PNB]